MKYFNLACAIFFLAVAAYNNSALAQKLKMKTDPRLSASLQEIINGLGLEKEFDVGEDGTEFISLAVIDLSGAEPVLGGVNESNFIYPASVYKMYVAAEILHQISLGEYSLETPAVVAPHNAVDKKKEIAFDPRPLLKVGDTVTIGYLLDLMITRSDNSAANCLIDAARRERINELIKNYGWTGSEVTRKFLSRKFEDPGYETVKGTETCALHAAQFLYLIETSRLINPWVSMQMKSLLGRQLDKTKIASGLPENVMFYNKTGWWSYWTHDAGIADDGKIKYIIAFFSPLPETEALPLMKVLSRKVYELLKNRHNP